MFRHAAVGWNTKTGSRVCVYVRSYVYVYVCICIHEALNMGGGGLGSGRMTVVRRTHNRRRTQNRGGKLT